MGEGKGCARTWLRLPSQPPHIYRGKGEGGRPPQIQSEEGAAARGVALPPKARGCPPLGFPPSPRRLGPWWGRTSPPGAGPLPHLAHVALWGRWPHLVDPRDPPGGPGTLPRAPGTFSVTKTGLPIYKSLPPDHSGTPRDVRDLIRDSEKHSVTTYICSL